MTQKISSSKRSAVKKQTTSKKPAVMDLAEKHQNAEEIFPDERHRMIAETAYLIAEQRDFHGDLAFDDWLQAEAEIDVLFVEKH